VSLLILLSLHFRFYPGYFASHGSERIPFCVRIFLRTQVDRRTSQALLDFSREFDIALLDNVVTTLYSGSGGKEVSKLILRLVSTLDLTVCLIWPGL
jgi:hypothetical protein